MKNIVLTTDFSDNSKNAIEYAIKVFGFQDVNYILVNSYEQPSSGISIAVSMLDRLKDESLANMDAFHKELKETYGPELQLEKKTYYGSITNVINGMANEMEIDYVVVGTKGASDLDTLLMGSNTMEAVKNITIPLLVVPVNRKFEELTTIALAADYKQMTDSIDIASMVDIASRNNTKVRVLHVQNDDHKGTVEEAVEGLDIHNSLKGIEHEFITIQSNNVITGIDAYIQVNNVQLLTMIARKRSFFENLFHRSVTKGMAKLAGVPMLILHEV